MEMDAITSVIESALEASGMSAREVSIRAGSPYLIRDIRRGHLPSVNRLSRLCRALGLELYVGPKRRPKTIVRPPNSSSDAAPGTPSAVRDRDLAALLAAIAEHWEELGSEYARRDFAANVYGVSSALGARRCGGSSSGSGGG